MTRIVTTDRWILTYSPRVVLILIGSTDMYNVYVRYFKDLSTEFFLIRKMCSRNFLSIDVLFVMSYEWFPILIKTCWISETLRNNFTVLKTLKDFLLNGLSVLSPKMTPDYRQVRRTKWCRRPSTEEWPGTPPCSLLIFKEKYRITKATK